MIEVTKINGSKLLINTNLIESVEETPDTMITLTSGKKIIVKESRHEVKNLVKLTRQEYFRGCMAVDSNNDVN
ncbi:MAG: flagellar FlbD family protein [Lachnospiraceae bacterium]|jgi:flagellar protein FlbD|nr:flagellar FlbD family protein [Lachnospiraceae bacterium]MCI9400218.1 flagellar FlbD family protein [Lachnospiraceae bacterium]MCX4375266.1 flagellar FlbD family protein [Lachnospiraceae bacterium]